MNLLEKVNILICVFLVILFNSNANRLAVNWINVTSSDSERLRILDFGFSTEGAVNISVEFLVPMNKVFVSEF